MASFTFKHCFCGDNIPVLQRSCQQPLTRRRVPWRCQCIWNLHILKSWEYVPLIYWYLARLARLHSCRQGWFFCPWQLLPPWRQPPCLVTPRGCNHILRNPCNWKSTKLHFIFDWESSLHDIEGPPRYEHIHHFFSVLIKPEPGGSEWECLNDFPQRCFHLARHGERSDNTATVDPQNWAAYCNQVLYQGEGISCPR